jgi:threonine aldolase
MIDIRSDTVTKPSPAMRQAMATAEVADDVLDGDPTVRRLEERTAELLGMERALFFPTGTMANQAAIAALTRPGTEIFVHDDAHIVNWEMAGAAALSGVQVRIVRGAPRMTERTLRGAIRHPSVDAPRASLLCLENTHAGSGGMVTPLNELTILATIGRSAGTRIFLDGARLWNASAATGTPLKSFAAVADLTMVSYSKGLGAPVGAAVVGPATLMEAVAEARKRFGGGMRQSGIIAAGALYGMEHNLTRLEEDHAHAKYFADIVSAAPDAKVVAPDTNIVMIDLPERMPAESLAARAEQRGVKVSVWHASRVRAVMHLDVSRAQVEHAATVLRDLLL